jgi:hypothetical protein
MRRIGLWIGAVTIFVILSMWVVPSFGAQEVEVSGASDKLLRKYEKSDRKFKRVEIRNNIIYFHQRKIDNAVVEKDFIIYKFDKNTGKLKDKKINWRNDLPESLPKLLKENKGGPPVTKKEAESMVEGTVQFSELFIIAPQSDVFPTEHKPRNPCWVVRSLVDKRPVVTIIDSVTGEFLGYGVPPPQITGFSLSGPWYFNPCWGTWTSWYLNAAFWFEEMGYPTEAIEWPTEEKVRGHLESTETAVFYELAHGGSYGFTSGCLQGNWGEYTSASELGSWISNYPKIPFTFLGSCGGMCNSYPGTLSYEFRKGSEQDTATVGYCGMAEYYCSSCWVNSIDWQNTFFSRLSIGNTIEDAFDAAMAARPMCFRTDGSCMRLAGDPDLTLVPIVYRTPPIEIPVDIKPSSCPNPLNIKSHGVLPVAIIGEVDFDITTVNPNSLLLQGVPPLRWAFEDVASPFEPYLNRENCIKDCNNLGPDGYMDLTLKFDTQEIVAAFGNIQDMDCIVLRITGNLREEFNNTPIVGEDVVLIKQKK